ncbi:ABC transporter substrate-binding protein [Eubacterium oxidoreducens]|uniref:Iron complex transport system substrate-binding protein n=1 Tax=Eubacterium oxidoreducens TaxID=1732 RepID=A0A1G6BP35_EUBOX|nr:ABC transporter substrate-binding protein [Eubacterium oxidoreducens]SDB22337.1 iron complex transport system substrate-binding protein [Eubacterium oxidoreducens]
MDQPAHLYVGASAQDAAEQAAEAVEQAAHVWEVAEISEGTLTLNVMEGETVTVKEISEISVPMGMTAKDNYEHTADGSESCEAEGEKTIYDLDGNEVTVPTNPEKLAAIYGPSYEALVVLGQEDRIVVCSDVQKENFPWAQKVFSRLNTLPCLDNVHSSVNIEELMTYSPDLVFSFNRPNELEQLAAMDICAIAGTTTTSLEEVPSQLLFYAHAVGNGAVEKAEEYETYFNEKLSYIQEKTKNLSDSDKPSVYYCGIDLLTTYGSYSDIPELIEVAGGNAVMSELKAGNHSQIDYEQLATWNPDYIFIDHGGISDGESVEQLRQEAYSDSNYSKIAAVSEKKVYLTPSGVFYWDMGLQKILLLEYVAKTIHPELFGDLDMVNEVQTFYEKFYDYKLTNAQAQKILERQDP